VEEILVMEDIRDFSYLRSVAQRMGFRAVTGCCCRFGILSIVAGYEFHQL